jgi:RNAse (barnase) inhibitor barstar
VTDPTVVKIDLSAVNSKATLLETFDETLSLGGPGVWGMNWDALADCLTCLDSGGIDGQRPRYALPLKLVIVNHHDFARRNRRDFDTLIGILADVVQVYGRAGKGFEYELA